MVVAIVLFLIELSDELFDELPELPLQMQFYELHLQLH